MYKIVAIGDEATYFAKFVHQHLSEAFPDTSTNLVSIGTKKLLPNQLLEKLKSDSTLACFVSVSWLFSFAKKFKLDFRVIEEIFSDELCLFGIASLNTLYEFDRKGELNFTMYDYTQAESLPLELINAKPSSTIKGWVERIPWIGKLSKPSGNGEEVETILDEVLGLESTHFSIQECLEVIIRKISFTNIFVSDLKSTDELNTAVYVSSLKLYGIYLSQKLSKYPFNPPFIGVRETAIPIEIFAGPKELDAFYEIVAKELYSPMKNSPALGKIILDAENGLKEPIELLKIELIKRGLERFLPSEEILEPQNWQNASLAKLDIEEAFSRLLTIENKLAKAEKPESSIRLLEEIRNQENKIIDKGRENISFVRSLLSRENRHAGSGVSLILSFNHDFAKSILEGRPGTSVFIDLGDCDSVEKLAAYDFTQFGHNHDGFPFFCDERSEQDLRIMLKVFEDELKLLSEEQDEYFNIRSEQAVAEQAVGLRAELIEQLNLITSWLCYHQLTSKKVSIENLRRNQYLKALKSHLSDKSKKVAIFSAPQKEGIFQEIVRTALPECSIISLHLPDEDDGVATLRFILKKILANDYRLFVLEAPSVLCLTVLKALRADKLYHGFPGIFFLTGPVSNEHLAQLDEFACFLEYAGYNLAKRTSEISAKLGRSLEGLISKE